MEELRKTTDPKDIILSLLEVIEEQQELIEPFEKYYRNWRSSDDDPFLIDLVESIENNKPKHEAIVENARAFIQHDFKIEMS